MTRTTPFRETEYVSARPRKPTYTTTYSYTKKGGQTWPPQQRHREFSYRSSFGESDDDDIIFVNGEPIPILKEQTAKKIYIRRDYGTNHQYLQEIIIDKDGQPVIFETTTPREQTPPPRRPRRASAATPQRPTSARKPMSSAKKQPLGHREATLEDAKRYRIPAGFSLKNWDPEEEPILLLGSVFDANSLGKWIYDWTVFHHGPATPISDVAGELWLLLIQLAGKVKRSEECLNRIRNEDNQLMIEDFIESGERLMDKLRKLLKACEGPMLKAGQQHGKKGGVQLGKGAGVEFVDSIFGRDRQLEQTEKLMANMRLWNLRFDANCEDILLNPSL
jgi:hypothetical protein